MTSYDRQKLWVTVYSFSAFEKAMTVCEQLLAECPDNRHPLFSPLSTAVHIFYARPFRRIDGIDPAVLFKESDVPEAHRAVHQFLLSIRDSMIAHTDAKTGIKLGMELHDVQLKVVPNDFVISCCDPTIAREPYEHALGVIREMHFVASKRFIEIKSRNESDFPTQLGDYILNLKGDHTFTPLKSP